MAEKKKTSNTQKNKTAKIPPVSERITDFTSSPLKDIRFIPKKKK